VIIWPHFPNNINALGYFVTAVVVISILKQLLMCSWIVMALRLTFSIPQAGIEADEQPKGWEGSPNIAIYLSGKERIFSEQVIPPWYGAMIGDFVSLSRLMITEALITQVCFLLTSGIHSIE
jgi:hypothetical protein